METKTGGYVSLSDQTTVKGGTISFATDQVIGHTSDGRKVQGAVKVDPSKLTTFSASVDADTHRKYRMLQARCGLSNASLLKHLLDVEQKYSTLTQTLGGVPTAHGEHYMHVKPFDGGEERVYLSGKCLIGLQSQTARVYPGLPIESGFLMGDYRDEKTFTIELPGDAGFITIRVPMDPV